VDSFLQAVHAPTARPYALGYSDGEFKRLEMQASLIRDLTENILRRAGVDRGMRVLDIGCGIGDVSLLAGEIVGPAGFVLGIDRSADAIAVAERRAASFGQSHWVHFAATELEEFSTSETFDALVGRLILMYLPDPTATLRQLIKHLRSGGIVAFQEMAIPLGRTVPEGSLFRQCLDWIVATFERAGFETDMGGKLFVTFLEAGLPAPQILAANHAGGGPDSPVYGYVAETVRSLLPMTERLGIATADQIQIDTLVERLRHETVQQRACVLLPPLIGAWVNTETSRGSSEECACLR
jgi:ubiquinone/menaquinone biosynthesis C-methylase UbiE